MPKLQIKRHTKEFLNNVNALIDGFTLIPVFNYNKWTMDDDIDNNDCPYVRDCFEFYYNDPGSYQKEGSYVLPLMRDKIGQSFNLSQPDTNGMTFNKFYFYSDILMAENIEGDPKRNSWTNEEWYYIRNSQKTVLSKGLDSYARPLYMTKFFSKPLAAMENIVQNLIGKKDTSQMLRYFIYSAHDTQILAVLDWLKPVNHEYIDATYTSTIYFELFYDADCLASTADQTCFSVHMTHNGEPFTVDTCITANQLRGLDSIVCRYDDFLQHITKIKFEGDIDQGCAKPFVKPTTA